MTPRTARLRRSGITGDAQTATPPALVMIGGDLVSTVALEQLPAGADAAEIIAHRGTTAATRDRIACMAQRWLVATVGEHGRNTDEWWLRWGMITAIARTAR